MGIGHYGEIHLFWRFTLSSTSVGQSIMRGAGGMNQIIWLSRIQPMTSEDSGQQAV